MNKRAWTRRRSTLLVAVSIIVLYAVAIAIGLHVKNYSGLDIFSLRPNPRPNWQPPHTIPGGTLGDSIRYGSRLFNETPAYARKNATAKISCANCHNGGGIQPLASPMVGLPATFPQFNQRAGHIISLQDRIQECFVRSENGKPLDYKGPEMRAITDYINWLSTPQPDKKPFKGRGLINLPDLTPDPLHGEQIYHAQCAGCHGQFGEGNPPLFPPLWGPNSFNDGAGMHGVRKMASFVQQNMPQNRRGILSAQDAYDVSAFIHQQPRPAFNQEYKHY